MSIIYCFTDILITAPIERVIQMKEKEKQKKDKLSYFIEKSSINTDPLGSWTGTPDNPNEEPVQDVDDL